MKRAVRVLNATIMAESPPIHVPVLLSEVIEALALRPGMILVDGTLGGGGHTRALAEKVGPDGYVLALDRDPNAVASAEDRLAGLPIRVAEANFCDLPEVLESIDVPSVDGILLDLGLSSDQLADPGRGFSFSSDGPLDLRFDTSRGEPTWRWMNRMRPESLADLIYAYGEERHSRRIARAILERRSTRPIETAAELAELLRRVIPRSPSQKRLDPATRTFQALRIASNEELKSLEIALRRFPEVMKPGAVLAIISFHSLEDRRVKNAFRDDPRLEVRTKRPIVPADEETEANPRARSARLRVATRRVGE